MQFNVISQLFILSPRGDKLLTKDFRGDVPSNTVEIFFRKFKFWDKKDPLSDAPPFFHVDGVTYCHYKKSQLVFVSTTRYNASPAFLIESLIRISRVLKDYLGVLSEDAIRKNFVLAYELVDECLDYGIMQETSTERLKTYVFNEPIAVQASREGFNAMKDVARRVAQGKLNSHSKHSTDAQRSVIETGSKGKKNEIYVDILEKLAVTFDPSGGVITAAVDGAVLLKSFLQGSPDLRLGLNEDLFVGKSDKRTPSWDAVVLDSANFHECANFGEFESEKCLVFKPPDGEFSLLNYRASGGPDSSLARNLPFRVSPSLETVTPHHLELSIRCRAEFPRQITATHVVIRFPVPKATSSVSVEFGLNSLGQSYEYRQADQVVAWGVKKFEGGAEHVCRVKITLATPAGTAVRREIGPISMQFEVPMFNVTGLHVRYLRINGAGKQNTPSRWVRSITQVRIVFTLLTFCSPFCPSFGYMITIQANSYIVRVA